MSALPGAAVAPRSALSSRAVPTAAAAVPADGVLEELDGTPILPSGGDGSPGTATRGGVDRGRRPAVPWWRAALLAATAAAQRPALWVYALVAFLARGGLLVLAGPIVVLPTLIGLSNLVGPASVTAGGPAPRLVAIVAGGIAAATILVVAGTVLAAAAEAALHRATVAPGARDARPSRIAFRAALTPAGSRRATLRITAIRLVLLGPAVLALALALPDWVAAAYRELTLPSDVAAPLVVRILAGAPAASGLVAVTWLAAEVVGGFAARRAALLDAGWLRALGAGLLDPLRAPVGTALTTVVALGLGIVALGLGIVALAGTWDVARDLLVDEGLTVAAVVAAFLLVATWIAALALAGLAAAVRAAMATAELLRHLPAAAEGTHR